MKRLLLALVIVFITLSQQYSQTIKIVDSQIEGQHMVITYDIISDKPKQVFYVSVFVSVDSGRTYKEKPLQRVKGDVGKNVSSGKNKKIVWYIFDEMPELEGRITLSFDVRGEVKPKNVVDKQLFIGYKGSVTAPIGLVAGITGKPGFYISAKANPRNFTKVSKETNATDVPLGWYLVPNEAESQRFSLTAGLQKQISKKAHLYGGIGFTAYNLLWQTKRIGTPVVTEWAKNTNESFKSYEVEIGMIYQVKHLFFSAGVTNYNKKYSDITFSVGVFF